MKIIDVERIIRRGAGSLAESLHFYWPSTGPNEVPESNIALHLGHAFLREGFLAYTDAHSKDGVKVHLDLLTLQPRAGILVAAEFKRLYKPEKVQSLLDDVPRILTFEPQDGLSRHPHLNLVETFGLLAGTTHEESYADWFMTDEPDPTDPTGGVLEALKRALPLDDTLWDGCVLSDRRVGGQRRSHWLVYALFPVRGSTPP